MRNVHLPETIDELWNIWEHDPEAVVYAGGTDLLVMLRKGMVNPSSLICLERIGELKGIRAEGEEIVIGACTTHTTILMNSLIRKHVPVLAEAVKVLGSPPIRHMGTIGGNIVNASPAGDTLPPLYVLDARVEILSREQSRLVPIKEFILGPGQVDMRRHEIVGGVRLPASPQYAIHHFEKVGRRKALACSVAGMAAVLNISDAGIVERARIAWGSVGPTVVTSPAVDAALEGRPLSEATLKTAIPLVENAVSPISDIRASAQYRKTVSGNLLRRLCRYSHSAHTTRAGHK